jgi:hypothetical protein
MSQKKMAEQERKKNSYHTTKEYQEAADRK